MTHVSPSSSANASSLDGLWVLLVENEGELAVADADGRVPMMARAGQDKTFLLGFKNMSNARKFLQSTETEGAEPRMVVKGNKGDLMKIVEAAGVTGILLDYDPTSGVEPIAAQI